HVTALSLMYDAIDSLGLHSTQWNYTAANRNDALIGDGWNQEDLSIFSRDQQDDAAEPDSGGRAIEGFCRPYARCVQGSPHVARFERAQRRFVLRFHADDTIAGSTEIYVPRIQFPDGFVVRFEGVAALIERSDADQLVRVQALTSGPAWLTIQAVPRNVIP
ncbi:MAG: endoglucanase, partial [Steroidobacteraceae bacterium]